MPQYYPTYYPLTYTTLSGHSQFAVLTPDILENELRLIAEAHNTHSSNEFSASGISSTVYRASLNRFVVPFGIRGSWALGAVTTATKTCSMAWPGPAATIKAIYGLAEECSDPSGGSTVPVKIYHNTTNLYGSADVENSYLAGTNPTQVISVTLGAGMTLAAGDVLDLRCSAQAGNTFKNVIFWIQARATHAG